VLGAIGCRGAAPEPVESARELQAGAPLERVLARWDDDEHRDLRAVVVHRGGAIVAERYYNGEPHGRVPRRPRAQRSLCRT
jgi:hypothetical protein